MDTIGEKIRRVTLATTRMDGAYYFFARQLGVKENGLALLYALDDGQPHSQREICETWLIPKTTISTIVKELVQAGYATLQPRAGSREKTICLTKAGQAYAQQILGNIYAAEEAAMARTLAQFSPAFIDAVAYYAGCLQEEIRQRSSREEKGY